MAETSTTATSSATSGTTFTAEEKYSSRTFYLGDDPGAILVREKLNGDNYYTWSRFMTIALSAMSKIGFVDGSIEQPEDRSSPMFNLWIRCDAMVTSWIYNSVSQEILSSVIYKQTARAVWLDLQHRFSQRNAFRIFQLQKEISNLAQNQSSVHTYFHTLQALWVELSSYKPLPECSCGSMKTVADYRQQENVMAFLIGLNDSFANIRARILLMDPLPSINRAFSLVLQDESLRSIGSNAISSEQPNRRERPVCSHCSVSGHVAEKCYKLHGYPPGYKLNG